MEGINRESRYGLLWLNRFVNHTKIPDQTDPTAEDSNFNNTWFTGRFIRPQPAGLLVVWLVVLLTGLAHSNNLLCIKVISS